MWTFASERRLETAAWSALAALGAAAFAFYWLQNHYRPIGGAISWPKLAWLAYALLLWVVLPALLSADPRLGQRWRLPFAALLSLMLARGLAEGWMLYVSLNWSPWYGMAHDVLCLLVLAAFAARLRARSGIERRVRVHLQVTAAAFVPEIYFAWYMQAHFITQGESAVYFVPDDPAYAEVLRVTIAVVVLLSVYFPIFLHGWLHGAAERGHSPAR